MHRIRHMQKIGRSLGVFLVCSTFGGLPEARAAQPTKGPFIEVEASGPAKLSRIGDAGDPGGPGGVKEARQRVYANVLAPIPARFLGGILIPRLDLALEERTYSGATADRILATDRDKASDERARNLVTPAGLIYLPHAAEGSPRWFLLAMRYGTFATRDTASPMGEFIAGSDFDLAFLRTRADDLTATRALLRYRKFPHGDRWLPVIEHRVTRADGWFGILGIPTQLTLGWQRADLSLVFQGGAKLQAREYPVRVAGGEGEPTVDAWLEGSTATFYVGGRQRVAGILFLSIAGGVQREAMITYGEDGHRLDQTRSSFAPWGKLGLETWVGKT